MWIAIISLSFSLFLLMDPIGNIPVFLVVLSDLEKKRHNRIIMRELLIALAIIILFALLGDVILSIFSLSKSSIEISGGIILFLIALKMIFPERGSLKESFASVGEPLIVPLAIPLVAGPAILAAVIIFSQTIPSIVLVAAIVIAWLFCTAILLSAPLLIRIFGEKGISALEKLMGLILTMIAVEMLLEGISLFQANNQTL
jgi:multiple antibiotic resistance protein